MKDSLSKQVSDLEQRAARAEKALNLLVSEYISNLWSVDPCDGSQEHRAFVSCTPDDIPEIWIEAVGIAKGWEVAERLREQNRRDEEAKSKRKRPGRGKKK